MNLEGHYLYFLTESDLNLSWDEWCCAVLCYAAMYGQDVACTLCPHIIANFG